MFQRFVCFQRIIPVIFSSAYQTETTADLRRYNSHSQWSIITQNKARAGCKNKHNISSVCEDSMALCKNCAIISPAFFKNKRINMSIFPTLVPFHAVLLLFISRSASAYLSMRRRREAGGHFWQELVCVCVCVHTCVSYILMWTFERVLNVKETVCHLENVLLCPREDFMFGFSTKTSPECAKHKDWKQKETLNTLWTTPNHSDCWTCYCNDHQFKDCSHTVSSLCFQHTEPVRSLRGREEKKALLDSHIIVVTACGFTYGFFLWALQYRWSLSMSLRVVRKLCNASVFSPIKQSPYLILFGLAPWHCVVQWSSLNYSHFISC